MAEIDVVFQEAVEALREGKKARARELLTGLLKTDQNNATYWVWMSATMDTPKERIYCLQTALKLDPVNRLGLHRRHLPALDLRRLDEATRTELLAAGRTDAFVRRYGSPFADLEFVPTAVYLQDVVELVRPLPPLAAIDAPVLALLSKGITFTDLEATARLLRALPRVEIERLDAYHWPLTEQPDAVREAIERWCARLPAAPD